MKKKEQDSNFVRFDECADLLNKGEENIDFGGAFDGIKFAKEIIIIPYGKWTLIGNRMPQNLSNKLTITEQ